MSAARQAAARIGAATLGLAGLTLVAKLAGFAEKQVIAAKFGTGTDADAYFVAISVPTLVFLTVRELVEPAFLPLFVANLEAGRRRQGWRLFGFVALGILALTAPIALAAGFFADGLMAALAPGFTGDTVAQAARLLRLTIGGSVVLGLSSLTYIALNGTRRFALPASGDIVWKLAPVVCVLVWAAELGIDALALGFGIGCVGRLLVHAFGLLRARADPASAVVERSATGGAPDTAGANGVRPMLWLMAPLVLGVAGSQVSELADNYFASLVGEGAVAVRTLARRVVDLPILLIPYALSVVAFPHFASLAFRGRTEELYAFLGRTLRGLAMLFSFLAIASLLLAEPIVTLLFERGDFGAESRSATVWPLQLYAAGLVTFALEAILVPFYFALRDTWTPVLLGLAGVAVNVTLTAALIEPLGVGGVALALTLSKSLKLLGLAILLRRKRAGLRFAPIFGAALRIGLAAVPAAFALWAGGQAWPAPGPSAPIALQAVHLAVISLAGAAAFVGVLLLRATPERELLETGASAVARWARREPQ